MFTLVTSNIFNPLLLSLAIPTLNNIALDYQLYFKINGIEFSELSLEQKEYELHDYFTFELGLNVFSEIKDSKTIAFSYGFQEANETFEINIEEPLSSQIEKLIHQFESFSTELAA